MKQNKRIGVIDALRGYFILWIGLFNTFAVFNALRPTPIISLILLLFNDKGWFCLSIIFGYGFGKLMQTDAKHHNSFPKRMGILFLIGILNNCFFYGDILKEFAIIGLLLYFSQKPLRSSPKFIICILTICTLLSIYTIPPDIHKVGNLINYLTTNNFIFDNIKYCFSLNIHSRYFGIVFHLEMLLLATLGYLMAVSRFGSLIITHRRKLFKLCFFLVLGSLTYLLSPIWKNLVGLNFFIYVLSLSTCFVIGFNYLYKKYTFVAGQLENLGRRSLTLYLCQNLFLATLWTFDSVYLHSHYNQLFFVFCIGQILLVWGTKFLTVQGVGGVEWFWRRLVG
ncbi:DUF418 domain-containing protein [Arcicella sp. LKC2W]|uniref:DUF418 domain-containing protein n=1 Tax=Arcicella sp. LKC2W TaxID=2984198 RepID=UPI002B1E9F63|nr:DUF418 domain-containing protein [Arcicella sp. LKC2W]MEA5461645.1 DUF418 domain-containing protein [Arcicella sp. LKC2W]